MERMHQFMGLVANIGVVLGLVFVAFEIRQNNQALEDAKQLAIAEAYQSRAEMVVDSLFQMLDSPYLSELSIESEPSTIIEPMERRRLAIYFRYWLNLLDNLHFQYERGYVDEEYYERQFKSSVQIIAPKWRALGMVEPRASFEAEVDRLLGSS